MFVVVAWGVVTRWQHDCCGEMLMQLRKCWRGRVVVQWSRRVWVNGDVVALVR